MPRKFRTYNSIKKFLITNYIFLTCINFNRYDVVYINLTQKPEWFLEKNPIGKVPCIELEGGEILYESLIIAEYLDEAYPQNKLCPYSPFAKAKDKLLIERFNGVINNMYKVFTE